MAALGFPKRIKGWVVRIYDDKWGRTFIYIFSASLFMVLGGVLYASFLAELPLSPFQQISSFAGVIVAAFGGVFFFVDKIMKIELSEKRIQIADTELQNKSIDNLSFSNKIANRIVSLFNSKTDSPDSIYEERSKHYQLEKNIIAEEFVNLLEKRICHLQSKGFGKIRLIFDSGTTISPIFNILGRKAEENDDYWCKHIQIITNNIKGVQNLLRYREKKEGHSDSEVRHSDIPLTCYILPGKVLSAYEAIASEETLRAFKAIKTKENDTEQVYTIGITTGNYVLYGHKDRNYAPIARTGLHPEVKAAVYHVSDEVYNVAPLGKILQGTQNEKLDELLKKFNDDLEFTQDAENPSMQSYTLVDTNIMSNQLLSRLFKPDNDSIDRWQKKSILITTERTQDKHILYQHFSFLKNNIKPFDAKNNTLNGPYLASVAFDDLPLTKNGQEEYEFPHKNIRKHTSKYFQYE